MSFEIKPHHFYWIRMMLPALPFDTPTPTNPVAGPVTYLPGESWNGVVEIVGKNSKDLKDGKYYRVLYVLHCDPNNYVYGLLGSGLASKNFSHRYVAVRPSLPQDKQPPIVLETLPVNAFASIPGFLEFAHPIYFKALKLSHRNESVNSKLLNFKKTPGFRSVLPASDDNRMGPQEVCLTEESHQQLLVLNHEYHSGTRYLAENQNAVRGPNDNDNDEESKDADNLENPDKLYVEDKQFDKEESNIFSDSGKMKGSDLQVLELYPLDIELMSVCFQNDKKFEIHFECYVNN